MADDDDAAEHWGDLSAQVAECLSHNPDRESNKIRVAVRVRPPNARELADDDEADGVVCVYVDAEDCEVSVSLGADAPKKRYYFDGVFPPASTQLQVFTALGVDLVASSSVGYNSTLFSYGQTGCCCHWRVVVRALAWARGA